MKKESKDYIPFGEEWHNEMKKINKDGLIDLLKKAYLELQQLKDGKKIKDL